MITILRIFRIRVNIKQEMMVRTELQSAKLTLYSNNTIQTSQFKVKENFHFTMYHKKIKLLITPMEQLPYTQMLFNQIWGLFQDSKMISIKIKT